MQADLKSLMQADLKSLMRAHLGELADETATLAALGDCLADAAEERRRLLAAFRRQAARASLSMSAGTDRASPSHLEAKDRAAGG